MRIALGTDEESAIFETVSELVTSLGHEVLDLSSGAGGCEWPEVGRRVALEVAAGRCDFGIVFCWTGTGVSIAANKVPGARAALCTDQETARGARRYNDANVLALSNRLLSSEVAREITGAFLGEEFNADEAATLSKLVESTALGNS